MSWGQRICSIVGSRNCWITFFAYFHRGPDARFLLLRKGIFSAPAAKDRQNRGVFFLRFWPETPNFCGRQDVLYRVQHCNKDRGFAALSHTMGMSRHRSSPNSVVQDCREVTLAGMRSIASQRPSKIWFRIPLFSTSFFETVTRSQARFSPPCLISLSSSVDAISSPGLSFCPFSGNLKRE